MALRGLNKGGLTWGWGMKGLINRGWGDAVGWLGWLCLAGLTAAGAQVTAPHLEILPPIGTNGWICLASTSQSNTVIRLEASTNLQAWLPIGTFHDGLSRYPDLAASDSGWRFYRATAGPRGTNDDWKNQILYPNESFRSANEGNDIRWVKFAILKNDPTRVYYQDSRKYLFHYDFAARRLAPFLGMDRASFEAISMHRAGQQVILGSVLYPPLTEYLPFGTVFTECGVQFAGEDAYTPEEVARWFEVVRDTVYATDGVSLFYMPTFEQSDVVRTNAAAFAARGIAVASVERWISGNSCYSPGWALGRLKYCAGPDIATAFAEGRLRSEDILLTDGVPAETPMVAGIISLRPSTPNSHTAILCQSFGIPFVFVSEVSEQTRVQGLVGHKVLLRATTQPTMVLGEGLIRVLDLEGALATAIEEEMLALKRPEPIEFLAKQSLGAFSASTDRLRPQDIQCFGGKAANFGVLRQSVPANCPKAVAFSFDLWDAFLDQIVPGGLSLRAEIAARLKPYTNYPPNILSLQTDLATVRELFTKTASFSPAQKQAITNALAIFDPSRKIRFRSSTNVEDTEHFTGAGLYDSFSGCLLDVLDGDSAGLCQCDPSEASERGVFRAMQKVYASFYNDNAFLERLQHGVDEAKVGMGVLVHHSFPDDGELANGVAALPFGLNGPRLQVMGGDMVTQLGAESVTNPQGNSVPEVMHAWGNSQSSDVRLEQRSSRVPLGAYVMNWPADYTDLVGLFAKVGTGYRRFYPAKENFYLDFEYKKDAQFGLVIKQVREIPSPDTNQVVTAFLIDEPITYRVVQAGGNGLALHRLKSRWTLHTANMRLSDTNLARGIYAEGAVEYVENGGLKTLSGPLSSWSTAAYAAATNVNSWSTGNGSEAREWQLETTLTTSVTGSQPPIFTPRDFRKMVSVTYASPKPLFSIDQGGVITLAATNEYCFLEACPEFESCPLLQERTFTNTHGLTIQSSFYWPKPPEGLLAMTSPLLRFVETRITGLTTAPMVLTNYYSQTYGAYIHNYCEQFVFEPRLEPGLPSSTLAELEAANVQLIYVPAFGGRSQGVYALGFDQKFRDL
jgi:hypothetical protein